MSTSHQYPPKFVAYYRVTEGRRVAASLSLEEQKADVKTYVDAQRGYLLRPEYTETENAKTSSRGQLEKAVKHTKCSRATLVIARLDRLKRPGDFISYLMKEEVPFVALDVPESDPVKLLEDALLAEAEKKKISERTKAALQAAKARGVKLGNPNPSRDTSKATAGRCAAIATHNAAVWPKMKSMRAGGLTYREIARRLNAQSVKPFSTHEWYASTVRNVILTKSTPGKVPASANTQSQEVPGKLPGHGNSSNVGVEFGRKPLPKPEQGQVTTQSQHPQSTIQLLLDIE